LRICIIGKYPPIQGGVSMRTYWTAHGLARCGHEVHVITNAREATPPFRMHMRAEDWRRCEAQLDRGSVKVHWTEPVDRSQSYLPMASPFVSKLAAIAARVHSAHRFDVIYSHYLEPYGVAAHLAAQITGVPHVARMAGSDAGRLWQHPQLEALYDHVLRSAAAVIATGAVAQRAIQRGVDTDRIAFGGGYALPEDLFAPHGPALDLAKLRGELEGDAHVRGCLWGDLAGDRPYFGIYGKLGDNKGSFALLSALQRLKAVNTGVGLVALAHGRPDAEERFRRRAAELGLADRVLQIPFLPHWRVPEFLSSCLAVCCLEQEFPIHFHSPITPLEVLLCGVCLVGSTEVLRKLPQPERLVHGYNCVAVEDVHDAGRLAERLSAIARNPQGAAGIAARGRRIARDWQRDTDFPRRLELILKAAMRGRVAALSTPVQAAPPPLQDERFALTRIAAAAMAGKHRKACPAAVAIMRNGTIDLAEARKLLVEIERTRTSRKSKLRTLAQAVAVEIAIAEVELQSAGPNFGATCDPFFRLQSDGWPTTQEELSALLAFRIDGVRVLHFDYDVAEFRAVRSLGDLPAAASPRPSHMVVFDGKGQREPLLVDHDTAWFLELCDGTRTVGEIMQGLQRTGDSVLSRCGLEWIENLFVLGLIGLRRPGAANRQEV
jgi:glycosyltransferase involved in cell wall biosynthesis